MYRIYGYLPDQLERAVEGEAYTLQGVGQFMEKYWTESPDYHFVVTKEKSWNTQNES